jgi:arsenate reductase
MKKVYYLSTCSTCTRIINELGPLVSDFEKQDIKTQAMSLDQIDHMKKLSGSYEALFSRKAMKYRSMGLGEKTLTEEDYRSLIQEEYTFLKRPVFIVDNEIFIGNSKKTIESLAQKLSGF